MKQAKSFTADSLVYPINDIIIKNTAGFCYSVLTNDKFWVKSEKIEHKTHGNKPEIADKMTNIETGCFIVNL